MKADRSSNEGASQSKMSLGSSSLDLGKGFARPKVVTKKLEPDSMVNLNKLDVLHTSQNGSPLEEKPQLAEKRLPYILKFENAGSRERSIKQLDKSKLSDKKEQFKRKTTFQRSQF